MQVELQITDWLQVSDLLEAKHKRVIPDTVNINIEENNKAVYLLQIELDITISEIVTAEVVL